MRCLIRAEGGGCLIKNKILTWLNRLKPAAIPTYVMAYAPQWLPDHSPQRLYVNLTADFIFLTSLFVLGGDFWDKLRALFVCDYHVEFGPRPSEKIEILTKQLRTIR